MNATEQLRSYTLYHPRWYRKPTSIYWWVGSRRYVKFILRELSSVFVAWTVVLILLQIRALRQGPDSYASFLQWMRNPVVIALNVLTFLFVVFHAVTWFNLAPKAMPVRVRGRRLPDIVIAAPIYAAWILISAFVGYIVLR
jgi:fumarate reductase subunit C